ncbi:MAG: hypothetical protein ABI658_05800 [Acidimicrobiales bacterium]
MKPRITAFIALALGIFGIALAFVVWPVAIPLGIFAIAMVAVTFLSKPTDANDRRLAVAGLLLGLVAIALGAAIAVSDSDGDDNSGVTASQPTFVDGIATLTPDAANPPQKDIENPLPCRVEIDALRAGGKITNHSSTPANYLIIVVWEQDGQQLGTNTSVINNVAPGLTTTFEVSTPGEGTLRTTCRVKQVDRTPSK